MWTLKNEQGDVMAQGSGPCAYDPTRYGWVSGSDLYGDPHRVLVYENVPESVASAVKQIDADVDSIYDRAIGKRQAEYEAAEREAQTWADASYSGPAPGLVQSWADAKQWPAQDAAEDILAQAAIWRGAQAQIRAQRLLRKEQAKAAETSAQLDGVMAAWNYFAGQVRQNLGL